MLAEWWLGLTGLVTNLKGFPLLSRPTPSHYSAVEQKSDELQTFLLKRERTKYMFVFLLFLSLLRDQSCTDRESRRG